MAAGNTNTALQVIEAGSVLAIAKHSTNGTTNTTWVWLLKAKEPGTLRWTRGWYEDKPWTDRGVMQLPFEGDEKPCEIGINFKWTGSAKSGDIYAYLDARDTTNGYMQMFTIGVWIPTSKSAASGDLTVFNKVYFGPNALKVAAGAKFDMLEIVGIDVEVKPTCTSAQAAPA